MRPSAIVAASRLSTSLIRVSYADGHVSNFNQSWLRHHCLCAQCTQPSSGQRLAVRPPACPAELIKATPDKLTVVWQGGKHVSEFDPQWLRRHCYSKETLAKERNALVALGAPSKIHHVDYSTLTSKDPKALHGWMSGFVNHGVCLLSNVPTSDEALLSVVALTGCSPSHQLYGETFKVETTSDPINVAYSTEALEPHQDLAYYEAPPGVQILHCQEFDASIQGGESTFVDGLAAAELLRLRDAKAFDVLTRVPATFQKDHVRRANPAKMYFQRPHIATHAATQDVVAIFWAPPFEGPLRVDASLVDAYYGAREAFANVLKDDVLWEKHGFKFRLQPGQAVMFNNRRYLHGREAFTPGRRKLHGCYLEMDSFLNRTRVLEWMLGGAPDSVVGWGLSGLNEARAGIVNHR